MHRTIFNLTSAFALMIGLVGVPAIAEAAGSCNVLLSGDGNPVKSGDDNVVAHTNNSDCGPKDAVSASSDPAASPDDVDAAATPGDAAAAEPAAVALEPLTVYFDSGSDSLSAASGAQVEAYAEQLKATSPTSIRVVGYTDSSGSADLNRKLSEARAANVAASLVEAGLPADLISKDAVGEGGLTIETPDAAGQANSRRVVVAPAY